MRTLAILTAIFCILGGWAATHHLEIGERQAGAAEVAGLEDTLMNGLKARLPVDRTFIKKVVSYVNQGKLPLKTVMAVFQYSRKKVAPKRRATVFRILLTKQAKKIGVLL